MKKLTKRQEEIYKFIVKTHEAETRIPTLREIGQAFHINSTNGVSDHLKALVKKGYLTHRPGKSPSVILCKKPAEEKTSRETWRLLAKTLAKSVINEQASSEFLMTFATNVWEAE